VTFVPSTTAEAPTLSSTCPPLGTTVAAGAPVLAAGVAEPFGALPLGGPAVARDAPALEPADVHATAMAARRARAA
jgi:hypothetical protein